MCDTAINPGRPMKTNLMALCRGGMFCGPKEGATEEDYYFARWTEAEKEAGDHRSVMKFVRFLPKTLVAGGKWAKHHRSATKSRMSVHNMPLNKKIQPKQRGRAIWSERVRNSA